MSDNKLLLLYNDNFYDSDNTLIKEMNFSGYLYIQDVSTERNNNLFGFEWEGRDI